MDTAHGVSRIPLWPTKAFAARLRFPNVGCLLDRIVAAPSISIDWLTSDRAKFRLKSDLSGQHSGWSVSRKRDVPRRQSGYRSSAEPILKNSSRRLKHEKVRPTRCGDTLPYGPFASSGPYRGARPVSGRARKERCTTGFSQPARHANQSTGAIVEGDGSCTSRAVTMVDVSLG
jgi:hypothetical protein